MPINKELVIKTRGEDISIAFLTNKKLIELHKQKTDNAFSVGDIYLGRVKKLVPGLNAAFVDVGFEKDGFLHYLDLGAQFSAFAKYTQKTLTGKQYSSSLSGFSIKDELNKNGNVTDVLTPNQNILVQVSKEPISTKGPRITGEVTLAGRYLVLVPFSDKISVSQKIKKSGEKERLKRLMQSIVPKNFGVIVRTVAEDKLVAELDQDLKDLVKKWKKCFSGMKEAKPPKRTLGELSRTSAILRDLLSASFGSVHVDDKELAEELKEYLSRIAPGKEKLIKLYKGKADIFDNFNIEKQIKASFGRNVTMGSGAYLVIEHTEALHVVDVNSGNTAKSKDSQEENALRVNIESAEEVARQLRLRDMGGIIVIDFIDLHKSENRKLLFEKMKEFMADDRAKHNILPPSKFGLIQITRQRVRPVMDIKTSEKCPTCMGSGEVRATVLLIDEIATKLNIALEKNIDSITICTHPFVEAYLKKGYPSLQMKWSIANRRRIKVRSVMTLNLLEYQFLDSKEDLISLN